MLANLNYITAIIIGVFAILATIVGIIVFFVRWGIKLKKIAAKMPELEGLIPRVKVLEDSNAIMQAMQRAQEYGFNKFVEVQGIKDTLLFRSIRGVAKKVGADDVVTLIDSNTETTVRLAEG